MVRGIRQQAHAGKEADCSNIDGSKCCQQAATCKELSHGTGLSPAIKGDRSGQAVSRYLLRHALSIGLKPLKSSCESTPCSYCLLRPGCGHILCPIYSRSFMPFICTISGFVTRYGTRMYQDAYAQTQVIVLIYAPLQDL